jgi:hydrogenase-4 component E
MIPAIAVVFAITLVYISSTSRLEAYIKAIAIQGLLLFVAAFMEKDTLTLFNFLFIAFETVVFKAIVIPAFLIYTVRKNSVVREIEPFIPNFYSVMIVSLILVFGFVIVRFIPRLPGGMNPMYFSVALSCVITGLFIIMSRKKIITHVMGFVIMENGIYLFAFAAASEMPFIVSMGVLLDLFAAIFMLGVFTSKINSTFKELDIHSLSELRD